jgi:hypothetical protein
MDLASLQGMWVQPSAGQFFLDKMKSFIRTSKASGSTKRKVERYVRDGAKITRRRVNAELRRILFERSFADWQAW